MKTTLLVMMPRNIAIPVVVRAALAPSGCVVVGCGELSAVIGWALVGGWPGKRGNKVGPYCLGRGSVEALAECWLGDSGAHMAKRHLPAQPTVKWWTSEPSKTRRRRYKEE